MSRRKRSPGGESEGCVVNRQPLNGFRFVVDISRQGTACLIFYPSNFPALQRQCVDTTDEITTSVFFGFPYLHTTPNYGAAVLGFESRE